VVRQSGDEVARWWSGVLGGGGGTPMQERRAGEGLVRCGILWGSSGWPLEGPEMAAKGVGRGS
jgi:hypothetical protein